MTMIGVSMARRSKYIQVEKEKNVVRLSEILSFYTKDFVNENVAPIAHLLCEQMPSRKDTGELYGLVYPLRLYGKRTVTTGVVVSVKSLTID